MHGFRPGLVFLYERLRLFREVLRVSVSHCVIMVTAQRGQMTRKDEF